MTLIDEKPWFVYMAECRDTTIYTGVSVDVSRRINAHNAGRGAKYTRSRRPVSIVYISEPMSRSEAHRQERLIKKWPRKKKLALIEQYSRRV